MAERGSEFWAILKNSNIPGAHEAHSREKDHQQELEQKALGSSEERRNRIQQASRDPRIKDYLFHAIGDEASLIAALQRKYELTTEADAIIALNRGMIELYDERVEND